VCIFLFLEISDIVVVDVIVAAAADDDDDIDDDDTVVECYGALCTAKSVNE